MGGQPEAGRNRYAGAGSTVDRPFSLMEGMRSVLVSLIVVVLVAAAFLQERAARDALRARIVLDADAYARLRTDLETAERDLAAAPTPEALVTARADAYAARIAAAASALARDDVAAARDHLDRAPLESRAWEWEYLRGQALRRVDERLRLDVALVRVAVSGDGRRLAVARDDGGLTLAPDGAPLVETDADPAAPERLGLAFAGDAFLVAALDQGGVSVRDAASLEQRATYAVHDGPVWQVAGATTSPRFATAAQDGTAKVVDAESGRVIATYSGHTGELFCVAVTPDGARAVTGGEDGGLRLWRTDDAHEVAALDGLDGWIIELHLTDDASLVCARTDLGEVALWRPGIASEDGGLVLFGGRDDPIASCIPSTDGRSVHVGRDDGSITTLDSQTLAPLRTLRWGGGAIERLFRCDDDLLFVSHDTAIRSWRRGDGADLSFPSGTDWVNVIALSDDGGTLVTGSADGVVRVHDARTGASRHVLPAHTRGVSAVAADRDGAAVTAGGGDGIVTRFDARTGERTHRLGEETAIVAAVGGASEDGGLPVVYGNGAMRVYDLASGAVRRETPSMSFWIHAMSSDLGRTGAIAWAAAGGNYRVFDLATGQKRGGFRFEGTVPIGATAWHDGTKTAALALASGDIEVWSAERDERIAVLEGEGAPIDAVAFHPDGRRLVTGDLTGLVAVWDVRSGTLLMTFRGTKQGITAATFSCDGGRLFVAGHAGVIDVFEGSEAQDAEEVDR